MNSKPLTDEQVLDLVRTELAQARTRYSWWPQDIVHAAAIASEESGEVIKSVNNYFWGHGSDTLEDIRKEAIQSIAMWIRFLTETKDVDAKTLEQAVQPEIIEQCDVKEKQDNFVLDWDTEVEYGSDEWVSRRSFELATGYGDSWDERIEQADAIAEEFTGLRKHFLVQPIQEEL